MDPAEFDPYHDSYQDAVDSAIRFSGRDVEFYMEAKSKHLLQLAVRHLGHPNALNVLDFGCGVGLADRYLVQHVRELHGVDVSAAMVDAARDLNPGVRYSAYDGLNLPFADAGFDLVFAMAVLHHVHVAQREPLMRELRRVTRPGGLVVIFEHNPLNPLTRLVVARCEFDEDAVLLQRRAACRLVRTTVGAIAESRYILFSPWRGRVVETIEHRLGAFRLGAQYYVAAAAAE